MQFKKWNFRFIYAHHTVGGGFLSTWGPWNEDTWINEHPSHETIISTGDLRFHPQSFTRRFKNIRNSCFGIWDTFLRMCSFCGFPKTAKFRVQMTSHAEPLALRTFRLPFFTNISIQSTTTSDTTASSRKGKTNDSPRCTSSTTLPKGPPRTYMGGTVSGHYFLGFLEK